MPSCFFKDSFHVIGANILPVVKSFFSSFCPYHSTGTALIKITNDLSLVSDSGNCAILISLLSSSAIYTTDWKTGLVSVVRTLNGVDLTLRVELSQVISELLHSPSFPPPRGVSQFCVPSCFLFTCFHSIVF